VVEDAIASGNAILRRFLEELAKQFRWHFAAVASARSKASWGEHAEILVAIEAGDREQAARLRRRAQPQDAAGLHRAVPRHRRPARADND
jgi:DNA-binding FadR family transcriptional regulator